MVSLECQMTTFSHFSGCTGLEISLAKTKMIMVRIGEDMVKKLLQPTGFQQSKLPFRYLGVHVKTPRLTKQECSILVKRILA